MSTIRLLARLMVATATFGLALVGLAAPASAAICTPAAGTATVDAGAGETIVIARNGADITVDGAACGTVTTIDTIIVNAAVAPTEIAIDLSGGLFEPGAAPESDGGASEIEFQINLPAGSPTLRVVGTTGPDHVVAGATGINLNAAEATGDADVTVTGTPAVVLEGRDGDDVLSIGGGAGAGGTGPAAGLLGGLGADLLIGGAGGSTFDGAEGTDEVDYAGATQLTLADLTAGRVEHAAGAIDMLLAIEDLTGSPGDDLILGNAMDNTISGADGVDTIDFGAAASGVTVDLISGIAAGEGKDTLDSIENVVGSAQADVITGDGAANRLDGGDGDDLVDGAGDADTLIGGAGDDVVSFGSGTKGVTVDLGAGTATGQGDDSLDGFEDVLGSKKKDTIEGDGEANTLDGQGGADAVNGGNGDDLVLGGTGADLLLGQRGDDILMGDVGKDQLDGGKGEDDVCKGGPDPDSFVLCENFKT